jgi:hypothetical protein
MIRNLNQDRLNLGLQMAMDTPQPFELQVKKFQIQRGSAQPTETKDDGESKKILDDLTVPPK